MILATPNAQEKNGSETTEERYTEGDLDDAIIEWGRVKALSGDVGSRYASYSIACRIFQLIYTAIGTSKYKPRIQPKV